MIDVSHPGHTDLRHAFIPTHVKPQDLNLHTDHHPDQQAEENEDDEEAAWLRSVQSAETDNIIQIKGLDSGARLVMDISHLRPEQPQSSAKKALKAVAK